MWCSVLLLKVRSRTREAEFLYPPRSDRREGTTQASRRVVSIRIARNSSLPNFPNMKECLKKRTFFSLVHLRLRAEFRVSATGAEFLRIASSSPFMGESRCKKPASRVRLLTFSATAQNTPTHSTMSGRGKGVRDSERAAPSATARSSATTSRASQARHPPPRAPRWCRLSPASLQETRGVLKVFLENVIRDAVTYTVARRKTVTMDVVYALGARAAPSTASAAKRPESNRDRSHNIFQDLPPLRRREPTQW